ncbi:MAG: hypothetical protein Q9161_004354 [Pseudevernia consocians]
MRTYSEEFHVMITAIGRSNARKLPEYPSIESYSGRFRHASEWDPIFNPQGKSFTVIGNGASGIEEVANLQKMASRLNHYARSPTWIAGSFAGEGEGRKFKPSYHLPETLRSFENSTVYLEFRKKFEGNSYGRFETMLRDSEGNKQLRKEFKTSMAEWTKDEPELLEHLLPNFVAQLQMTHSWTRISRGLVQRNVDYIRTPIAEYKIDEIVTTDRVERKVEEVICCTGANTDKLPPFAITVPGNGCLQDAWTPDPYTYLGVAVPCFPNLVFNQGSNGTCFRGTVPNQIETQKTYFALLLREAASQRHSALRKPHFEHNCMVTSK